MKFLLHTIIMDVVSGVLALLVAILWAGNTVINKYVMDKSIGQKTVIVIGAFTFFTSMLLFAIYNSGEILGDIKKIKSIDIILLIGGAIFGLFFGNILFMYLLEKNNSSVVAALAYTAPVFVFIMSLIILKERIERIKILGIALTVSGVAIICT